MKNREKEGAEREGGARRENLKKKERETEGKERRKSERETDSTELAVFAVEKNKKNKNTTQASTISLCGLDCPRSSG